MELKVERKNVAWPDHDVEVGLAGGFGRVLRGEDAAVSRGQRVDVHVVLLGRVMA